MRRLILPLFALWFIFASAIIAQDNLSRLPGYENYQRISSVARQLGSEGRVSNVDWSDDGATMTYQRQGDWYKVTFSDFAIEKIERPEARKQRRGGPGASRRPPAGGQRVGRAEQATRVASPDGKWVAIYKDYNVVIESVVPPKESGGEAKTDADGAAEEKKEAATETKPDAKPETIPVTASGSEFFRFGTGCWVYGEELFQSSAMWWSPDSRRLAFYEIDERHMQDYYLTTNNVELYTTIQDVRYPKAGMDNPYAGLLIYDLDTKLTTRINVGGDRLQYVFDVRFTPDGSELLFSRTNRHQDILEIMAADPVTGESRLVVSEQQPTWQNNKPLLQFLADGKRFIWETERNGWKHFELRHLDGRLLNPLSHVAEYPAESVVRVDEGAGLFYYTAYSSNNPLNAQFHRVRLDGTEYVQLTGKPLHHSSFNIAPNHKWFVASYEAVDVPPTTALFNDKGEEVAVLGQATWEKAEELGLSRPELFTFKADDGKTDLQGILHKPAHFDPNRKYPLVISVYGGPSSRGISNRYDPADAYCEFGFLVATIANRGTTGRGKAFETATYLKLGIVDIKDQADGVKLLCQRPYVDASRVGIFGHSYGGYMSALAVLKYPDVFHVGVAGAPVTDWKNYDTIYTERYMRTPVENPEGYHDGSCLTYADNLKGNLLIMHGLIDDNVHPSNTWQLADLLQQKDRRFDMMIYPHSKHGLGRGSTTIRWEYLHEHLRPEPLPVPAATAVTR